MSEENGAVQQGGVTPHDLLTMIGELTVENRLLRARIQELEQTTEKEEVHAGS